MFGCASIGSRPPIPLPLQTPIVLPHGLVQPHANPLPYAARDLLHLTDVHDLASLLVLPANPTPLPDLDTTMPDLRLEGLDFGLLEGGRRGVEPSQLLGFLPREDAVRLLLVLLGWHLILFCFGDVGVVGSQPWRAGIGNLKRGILEWLLYDFDDMTIGSLG